MTAFAQGLTAGYRVTSGLGEMYLKKRGVDIQEGHLGVAQDELALRRKKAEAELAEKERERTAKEERQAHLRSLFSGLQGGGAGAPSAPASQPESAPAGLHSPASSVTMPTREFQDGQWTQEDAAFRRYEDSSESAQDWLRLMGGKRYEGVRNASTLDEAIDAQARSGYATDPDYGAKLRSIRATSDEQAAFLEARRQELIQAGASPVLADLGARQAVLESGWGRSGLSRQHNNYFGIKAPAVSRASGSPSGQTPASGAGLGQAPSSSAAGATRGGQQAERYADAYQRASIYAATNPDHADEIKPAMDHLRANGMASWMQSFEGDPTSLAAWKHYARGAAKFGVVVSPDKGMSVRISDQTNDRAERKDQRVERKELRAEQKEQLAQRKQAILAMGQFLQDGELSAAEQNILSRNFDLSFTGRTRRGALANPGTGKKQEVVEYEVALPDGSSEWYSKESVVAEAAAFAALEDKEASLHAVEQRDEWGEVKSKGWGVQKKDAAGNTYLQEVPVRPAAGLGAAPPVQAAAPQGRPKPTGMARAANGRIEIDRGDGRYSPLSAGDRFYYDGKLVEFDGKKLIVVSK